ncbi:serine/threonine protein phosphatase 5, partial [Kipferlia bialata]
GSGYLFGALATKKFLLLNNMQTVVRAHQVAMGGHQWHFEGRLVTVFSAPNYCYQQRNKGSVMHIRQGRPPSMTTYTAVPDQDRVMPPAGWDCQYGYASMTMGEVSCVKPTTLLKTNTPEFSSSTSVVAPAPAAVSTPPSPSPTPTPSEAQGGTGEVGVVGEGASQK